MNSVVDVTHSFENIYTYMYERIYTVRERMIRICIQRGDSSGSKILILMNFASLFRLFKHEMLRTVKTELSSFIFERIVYARYINLSMSIFGKYSVNQDTRVSQDVNFHSFALQLSFLPVKSVPLAHVESPTNPLQAPLRMFN